MKKWIWLFFLIVFTSEFASAQKTDGRVVYAAVEFRYFSAEKTLPVIQQQSEEVQGLRIVSYSPGKTMVLFAIDPNYMDEAGFAQFLRFLDFPFENKYGIATSDYYTHCGGDVINLSAE